MVADPSFAWPPFWQLPQWCAVCNKALLPLKDEPKDFGAVLCGACA